MRNKFFKYLDNLEDNNNQELIEAVKSGYNAIFEAIILSPTPYARITGWDETPDKSEPIASDWNVKQNKSNEYFEQTLPDSVLDINNKSYIGQRIGEYPKLGRTHVKADGDKYLNGTWGNSGGDYAGDSYGYNLGGPAEA